VVVFAARAVRLDPGLADAHFLLGQLYAERYYRLRDPDALRKAEVHYLRAIALQPDHLEAWTYPALVDRVTLTDSGFADHLLSNSSGDRYPRAECRLLRL